MFQFKLGKIKYPTEITKKEITLGYKLMKVENPNTIYAIQDENVDAVVCMLSNKQRIIKCFHPMVGRYIYHYDEFKIQDPFIKGDTKIGEKLGEKWTVTNLKSKDPARIIHTVEKYLKGKYKWKKLRPEK